MRQKNSVSFIYVIILSIHIISKWRCRVDLLSMGGHLIDPANKLSSKLNIAIEKGKIVEISNKVLQGDKVINAKIW